MAASSDKKRKPETGVKESGKKSKVVKEIPEDVILSAWDHYRSYMESEEEADEDNEPDFDELFEILNMLEPFVDPIMDDTSISALRDNKTSESMDFPNIESLLPALLSMVYLHLADNAITQGFEEHEVDPEEYLDKSLSYFPMNAAALALFANYQRMNMLATISDICSTYELAASSGNAVRNIAVEILKEEDDENTDRDIHKEAVELLLLDGIAGAELVEDEEEDEINTENPSGKEGKATDESDDEEQEEIISTSAVEATSSFMSALLHSTMQHHDKAIAHLAKFDFSHRIHPNVWLAATDSWNQKEDASAEPSTSLIGKLPFEPKSFQGPLPDDLHKRLCKTFSPSAAFWSESDYQNRGYFSFFEDITTESKLNPRHLIDDVVLNYLLPRAQTEMPSETIVGYEFWAHTRPLNANLGHQLHFDTDEALLSQEKKVTHPLISSVLYLTGNRDEHEQVAGSTIIFNQSPSSGLATKAYFSHAQDGKFMIFPGSCLHGVLPCSGQESNSKEAPVERLTIMVGFWTRRVPDKMKDRHLYGPCSPLPEADTDNTWVAEIYQGYESKHAPTNSNEKSDENDSHVLPSVSPAWEDISSHVNGNTELKLDVPTVLDHRFFVKDAASCFRESLFKK
jgi:hypothetical protein